MIILLVTVMLSIQTRNLTIDTRDESFFHDDAPILIDDNHFRDTFGQDDNFIIALKPQDGFTVDFF